MWSLISNQAKDGQADGLSLVDKPFWSKTTRGIGSFPLKAPEQRVYSLLYTPRELRGRESPRAAVYGS